MKLLQNLRMKKKLLLFPVLFIIVVAVIFLVTLWSNNISKEQLDSIQKEHIPYVEISNELISIQKGLQKAFQDGVAAQDLDKIDQTLALAERFRALTDTAKTITGISNKAELDSTATSFNDYYQLAVMTSKSMIAEEFSESVSNNMQLMISELTILKDLLSRISLNAKKEMSHAFEKTNSQSETLTIIIHIVLILSLAIFITISLFLSRGIVRALHSTTNNLLLLSQGQLDIDVSDKYLQEKDEIGDISRAINTLVTKLSEVITGVQTEVIEITNISENLNRASELMAEGSNEQAASVEEVSSTMEEILSNIDQTASNSVKTERVAAASAKDMKLVSKAAEESLESVASITDKINIISDIALQTNILALNAAVEAARAGEHGRGFSVVASEVRKLAEKSKMAADEITQLAQISLDNTGNSESLTSKTIPEIEKTSLWIQEISVANVEQKSGVEQVNQSVQQLSHIAQQNAASSEQMASTSDRLTGQAQKLLQLISYFKVDYTEFQ